MCALRTNSDDLELVFAELTKFDKTEVQLESLIDRWFYFLKHADDLTVIPASLQNEPAICQAFDIANKAGLSAEELLDQERREMFIQDQRGAIELALQRGLGQGREEGARAAMLRIAASLLDVISDDRVLAEKTGFSRAGDQTATHGVS